MTALPRSHFTTDALHERDRFSGWRDDVSVIFDVEECSVGEEEPFHADFDLYYFGQSVLAELKSSTGRYLRSKQKATRDGLDGILLQLFLEGGVQFNVRQRTTYAHAGDIVVFDLAQPVDNINTRFRHITSMWPRAAIEQVVPDIAHWHGRTLPREKPAVDLLRRHMATCYDLAPRFSIGEGQRVENATLALVAAAIGGGELLPDSASRAPMAEMLTYQIKRFIRENLSAANLSPAHIAQHFGISRTELYRLLEPLGGISRYQRHLRLQRCLADLQDPGQAHLQIAEIAYRWGFNHPATFNRNFRQAFGITPGDARAQAVGRLLVTPPCSPARFKRQEAQREHHLWFQAIGI